VVKLKVEMPKDPRFSVRRGKNAWRALSAKPGNARLPTLARDSAAGGDFSLSKVPTIA